MLLGLHHLSLELFKIFAGIAWIMLTIMVIINYRCKQSTRSSLIFPLGAIAVSAVILALASPVIMESRLDARDADIKKTLSTKNVEFVESYRVTEITVKSGDCVAKYASTLDSDSSAWPLKSGTGTAISGCEGVVLDDVFIPSAKGRS